MSSTGLDFYGTTLVDGVTSSLRVLVDNDGGTRLTIPSGNLPAGPFHVELDSSSGLGLFESTKPIELSVEAGEEKLGITQLIETMWPSLPHGPLSDTFTTYSRVGVPSPAGPLAISFGFGDTSGAPAWTDTAYLTATPVFDRWMGDLVEAHPDLADRPFTTMTLPGAHNAGMFSPGAAVDQTVQRLASRGADELLTDVVDDVVGAALTSGMLSVQLLVNSAFCQKDDISTQLDLGARFFDIRPGTVPAGSDELFHVHNFVPGASIRYLLTSIAGWLALHPTEIVVLRLSSNVNPRCGVDAARIAREVSVLDGAPFRRGDRTDLDRTVADLLSTNTRMIVLDGSGGWGSWGDEYSTDDPHAILGKLVAMTPAARTKADQEARKAGGDPTFYTLLELQTSGTKAGLLWGQNNRASGELIRLKPRFDAVTHPWLRAKAAAEFDTDRLLVLGNDFVDGLLTDVAIDLTRQRLLRS